MENIQHSQNEVSGPEKSIWNEKLEQTVKNIGESAQSYKHMHVKLAQKTSRQYFYLMLVGMLIGPLGGTLAAVGAIMNPDKAITIGITTAILGYISGVVVAVVKFGKFDEVSLANKQAAARYTSLESNVRRQLALYRNDRVQPYKYLEWLEAKYDELFYSAPLLPDGLYESFVKKAKENGYHIPDQYSNVISINKDYTSEQITAVLNKDQIVVNNEVKTGTELDLESGQQLIHSQTFKGNGNTIQRTKTMTNLSELNQYSDQMLKYQMERMMGFTN